MKEYDLVALLIDLPENRLFKGDVGTIVFIYDEDKAYEVEFINADGKTIAVETLEATQIIPIKSQQAILHVNLTNIAA